MKFDNIYGNHFYDGIHLNETGVKMYVRKVKVVTNTILGVNVQQNQNYTHTNNTGYKHENSHSSYSDMRNRNEYNQSRYMYSRESRQNVNRYRHNDIPNQRFEQGRGVSNFYSPRPEISNESYNMYSSYNRGVDHDSSVYGKKENVARLIEQILRVV